MPQNVKEIDGSFQISLEHCHRDLLFKKTKDSNGEEGSRDERCQERKKDPRQMIYITYFKVLRNYMVA